MNIRTIYKQLTTKKYKLDYIVEGQIITLGQRETINTWEQLGDYNEYSYKQFSQTYNLITNQFDDDVEC